MNLKKFSILICLIYTILFLILPHSEYQPADPGIKVLQVKDFILSGYSSFSANYQAREFDPSLSFFPTRPPFAYTIADKAYYVFPFFATILFTPFYLIGGVYALDFLSLVSALATIFLIYKISILLNLSEKFQKPMLLFSSVGSITSVYAFILGEGVHASLLITLAVFLILRSRNDTSASISFLLAGILSGFSVLFRIELALFCILLFVGIVLFKIYSDKLNVFFLAIGLIIPACVLIYANYKVTGNVLGLRGIEFLQYSGGAYPIEKRFFNLFKALFVSDKGLGLFTAWPIFLFIIPFFISIKNFGNQKELFFLLFLSVLFTLCVPILVKNDDGSILGPRFAATLQPILIPAVFYSIELLSKSERFTKWIAIIPYFVYYSIFISFLGYIILFLFVQNSHRINMEFDKKMSGEMIILRRSDLSSIVYPSYYKRPILTIEREDDLELFFQKNKGKVPIKLSILSSTDKAGTIFTPTIPHEIIDSSSKNGILLQNINLK